MTLFSDRPLTLTTLIFKLQPCFHCHNSSTPKPTPPHPTPPLLFWDQVWPSAFAIVRMLEAASPSLVANKRVIELGSGTLVTDRRHRTF